MLNPEGLLKEKKDFLTLTSQDLIEIVFYFLLFLFYNSMQRLYVLFIIKVGHFLFCTFSQKREDLMRPA